MKLISFHFPVNKLETGELANVQRGNKPTTLKPCSLYNKMNPVPIIHVNTQLISAKGCGQEFYYIYWLTGTEEIPSRKKSRNGSKCHVVAG